MANEIRLELIIITWLNFCVFRKLLVAVFRIIFSFCWCRNIIICLKCFFRGALSIHNINLPKNFSYFFGDYLIVHFSIARNVSVEKHIFHSTKTKNFICQLKFVQKVLAENDVILIDWTYFKSILCASNKYFHLCE